jgi:hypothetical protein
MVPTPNRLRVGPGGTTEPELTRSLQRGAPRLPAKWSIEPLALPDEQGPGSRKTDQPVYQLE